jgi:dolichol-phosphate mannosyltransferase
MKSISTNWIRSDMISIIIPLFNESENIIRYPQTLFPAIKNVSELCGETFEFIMVDDGSTDDTYSVLLSIGLEERNVKIIHYKINSGMGTAIRKGIAGSHGELIITMDSDLTFRPEDIPGLIRAYRSTGADCISGSPYLEPGMIEEVEPFRLLLSKTINYLYRILLGGNISCVSPIFRLYRKSSLDEITITSRNFEINAEILSKFILTGKTVVEVPVQLRKRRYGKSKINLGKEIRNYLVLFYKIFMVKYAGRDW